MTTTPTPANTTKQTEYVLEVHTRSNRNTIWVTFDKVGFHRYPDAPEEVAYLRDLHRHVFRFSVRVSVQHEDRDIEFHMFKKWLTSLYDGELQVDYKSCEMLANELLEKVVEHYDCRERLVVVDVSEDGECGATVESLPAKPIYVSADWIREQAVKLSERQPGQEVA